MGSAREVCYAARPYNFIVGASGKLMKCTIALDTQDANVLGRITARRARWRSTGQARAVDRAGFRERRPVQEMCRPSLLHGGALPVDPHGGKPLSVHAGPAAFERITAGDPRHRSRQTEALTQAAP